MNAQQSVVRTFGPDDEDTVEHVILRTCAVEGCDNQASWDSRFCVRCDEEIDALGLRPLYPKIKGVA